MNCLNGNLCCGFLCCDVYSGIVRTFKSIKSNPANVSMGILTPSCRCLYGAQADFTTAQKKQQKKNNQETLHLRLRSHHFLLEAAGKQQVMEKVISCFKKNPDAAARLVCFPWAGGGSIHYARWGNVLDSSTEVFAVKLPGRESRAKEAFFQSMQQIVDEVIGVLLPLLREKPFALFGHSFGAFTSFAVADALKKQHNIEPVHIFLSGASAPYSETRLQAPKRSSLSDDDFLKWLISIGGTPPELLGNPDVLKLFLPALKADLHVVENYRCNKPVCPFLSCPITCFDGRNDIPHDLQAWKDATSGDFTVRLLDGAHFYLKDPENEKIILDYITKHLETSEMDYL